MSAPTPASGDERPREGYYPDPSIPGYVRYWNGVSWVPGTSRPAPADGSPLPAPPGAGAPAVPAAEETGPVFFADDPSAAARQENGPATAALPQQSAGDAAPGGSWGADPNRQTGFGQAPDSRVGWGTSAGGASGGGPSTGGAPAGGSAPGASAPGGAAAGGADPRAAADPRGAGTPADGRGSGADDVPSDGTVTMRAVGTGDQPRALPGTAPRPQLPKAGAGGEAPIEGTVMFRRPVAPGGQGASGASASAPAGGESWGSAPQGGDVDSGAAGAGSGPRAGTAARRDRAESPGDTMAIRLPKPTTPEPATPAPAAAAANAPAQNAPAPHTPASATTPAPAQTTAQAPGQASFPGPAAGWPHQQGAPGGAESEPPVVPWKPPVEDPFLAAAQAQAAGRPAALGKRLLARLIDTLVVGGVTALAAVPLGTQALDHINDKIDEAKLSGETVTVWLLDGTTSVSLAVVLAVLFLTGLLYEALPTAKWGRTLGKKLCGLDVRDIEAHEPPRFGASVRRWLTYTLPGLLVIGVVGVLWCVFDRPWRQCWHDKAARTFVAG